MKLTPRLLGYLNRVFDKEPKPFLALRVRYAGAMSWAISDGVLTFNVSGGPGTGASFDLSAYTLRSLAAAIAALAGYEVRYIDASRDGLSALVLLDGAGDQDQGNGDHLLGYTSILWALFEAYAVALQGLRDQVAQVMRQMTTKTAEGAWLDEIGSYYGIVRSVGEVDALYAPRIIAQTLRPLANNVAIERAIEDYTGQPCSVDDVVTYASGQTYDGTVHHDATIHYDSTSPPKYGLFDIGVAYDLILGGDIASFLDTIAKLVERLRAAGTHLRAIALRSPMPTVDVFPFSPSEMVAAMGVATSTADTLTAPADTTTGLGGALLDIVDVLTAPTDMAAGFVNAILTDETGAAITDEFGAPILVGLSDLFV